MKKTYILGGLIFSAAMPMLASNADNFKAHDPIGWMMAIISMGVVFLALLILFICFKYGYTALAALGLKIKKSFHRKQQYEQISSKRAAKQSLKVTDATTGEEVTDEELAAAIGVALFLHEDGMHDQESNVLTLNAVPSAWTGAGMNHKKSPNRKF